MTLDGTNTWVLQEPGASASVVVDPGPIEDGHLERLTAELGDVGLVLLTHHHFDHAEVAAEFAARKGCAVRALDPALCVDADAARRRRGPRRRRARGAGAHDARPHRRLDLAGAARRRRAADRRHGAGAGYDGRGAPRRPARPVLRLDLADALAGALRRGDDALARARSGAATTRSACSTSTSRTGASGWRRSSARWPSSAYRCSPAELAEDESLPRQVVEVVYADVDESLWVAAELSVRAQLAYLAAR